MRVLLIILTLFFSFSLLIFGLMDLGADGPFSIVRSTEGIAKKFADIICISSYIVAIISATLIIHFPLIAGSMMIITFTINIYLNNLNNAAIIVNLFLILALGIITIFYGFRDDRLVLYKPKKVSRNQLNRKLEVIGNSFYSQYQLLEMKEKIAALLKNEKMFNGEITEYYSNEKEIDFLLKTYTELNNLKNEKIKRRVSYIINELERFLPYKYTQKNGLN